MKRLNSLYNMVSRRFNLKRNNGFDEFNWSYVVKYLYTRRVYIIGELNEEKEQALQAQNNKR